jgi:hypothetical protein
MTMAVLSEEYGFALRETNPLVCRQVSEREWPALPEY